MNQKINDYEYYEYIYNIYQRDMGEYEYWEQWEPYTVSEILWYINRFITNNFLYSNILNNYV